MTRKWKYREFLKTAFWKALSAEKKSIVKKCERCGCKKRLQSHHRFYRDNWFDTVLSDLEVLCRGCHREHHGMARDGRFFPYRDDERFNRYMHRCSALLATIRSRRGLRERDRAFLEQAKRKYPDAPGDSAVSFHVGLVYRWQKFLDEGVL